MSSVAVQELELLSFFAVEPQLAAGDQGWPYNGFVYRARSGEVSVEFEIWPADNSVRLAISGAGQPHYELTCSYVEDVRYHLENQIETLEIIISGRNTVWFQMLPSVLLRQFVAGA